MTARLKPIRDQVIVVTDAASPIGAVVARRAAAAGARVLLVGPKEAQLGEAVRAINNAGGRADYAVAAAGHDGALAAAGRVAVNRFGRVDGWFAAVADETALAGVATAAVPLLRREGGALVVAADAAVPIEPLRQSLRGEAPLVALAAVAAPAGADPDRIATSVLVRLEKPGRDAMVDAASRGFAARHPGLAAAVGVGGLALAAGAVARWRRGRVA